MKGAAIIKKIAFSSWFLAFIPTIIIFLFLPPLGSEFTLLIEPTEMDSGNIKYADLDSDGISEKILSGKSTYNFIVVQDNEQKYYDQWNLTDNLNPNITDIFFGNYDHDSYLEIYAFTNKEDSLFLNINEALDPTGTKLERIFISRIGYINGEVNSGLRLSGFFDENGDNKDELYFFITTGFSFEPRREYSFDLVNKKLKSSEFTGFIFIDSEMADVDGDNKPEIFGTLHASGNYKTKAPFSDQSTWFMVFDEQLKFEFPPVEFAGFANFLEVKAYYNGIKKQYVLSHWARDARKTVLSSRILLYSLQGKPIRYKLYSDFGFTGNTRIFIYKNKYLDKLYLLGDRFLELDDNLEIIRTINIPFKTQIYSFEEDIDADGKNEYLVYSEIEEKLMIYSSELHKLTEQIFKTPNTDWKFSSYLSVNNKPKIYLSSGDQGYFLQLKKNSYYYFSYLVYPAIYFLIFFFILAIRRITTYQVVQKESYKNRLISLQLQAIKSQLDPHFTFNALNSIASLIYLEDRHLAYDYMNKFTQLLRTMLNDAELIYRSLGEEIEFVKTYVDLEKLRFGEKFRFVVEIEENVNLKYQVPKMVIQTFAENAIKHGLMPCSEGGLLLIKVEIENESLKITIEDNGIGRAKSAGRSTSTGKGLMLTGEFYQILNQMNQRPIKHVLTDLFDEMGVARGTMVEVWVPVTTE